MRPSRLQLVFVTLLLPFFLLASIRPETRAVLGVLFILYGLVLVSDFFISRQVLDDIQVFFESLVRFSKDREGELFFRLSNPQQKKTNIDIGLPLEWVLGAKDEVVSVLLPDGVKETRSNFILVSEKRGKYFLKSCYLSTKSIFGFWEIKKQKPIDLEIRVYPNLFKERSKNAVLFLNRGDHGSHVVRLVGQGREFEKLREYQVGDNFTDIHWKATARKARPITKTYQMEKTQEVYVALDFSRLSRRMIQNETTLEGFLSSSLIMAMAAERQGDHFGLLAFSNRVHKFLKAKSGPGHFGTCRELLYNLEPHEVNPDFTEVFTTLRTKLRHRSLIIFLTELDDPVLKENFLEKVHLISRQHLVLVNVVRPDFFKPLFSDSNLKSDLDIYKNLASHLSWQNLRELEKEFQRQGVFFSELTTHHMSSDLVNQYMKIKQRQLL